MFKHLNTRIPKRIEQEKDKVSAVMIPPINSHNSLGKSVSRAAGENMMKHLWRLQSVKLVKNY